MAQRVKKYIPIGWITATPFVVKILFTLPVLNTFSWSPYRLFRCFSDGEWYHKVLSVVFLILSLTPLTLVDTFHLIFIDHDEVLMTDLP